MATYKKRPDFLSSEEGMQVLESLKRMAQDDNYYTESSYSANTALHADNLISFVDKHMRYLQEHPGVNSQQYISNLRLMTKVKSFTAARNP